MTVSVRMSGYVCLCLSLPLPVFVSVCFCLSVSDCRFLSVCLFPPVYICLSLSAFLSLSVNMSLSLSVFRCLCYAHNHIAATRSQRRNERKFMVKLYQSKSCWAGRRTHI